MTGRTILDVYEWVQLHGHATCLQILANHPGSTRADVRGLPSGCSRRTAHQESIRDTIDLLLAWAILPGLAAAVTPAPGQGFSAEDFTPRCGTLYLIASGDDDSPVTPLFRALAQLGALRGRAGRQQAAVPAPGPAAADGPGRGDPDLPGRPAGHAVGLGRQGRPAHAGLPLGEPAGEPLGQARRRHDLVDVRDQGAARRRSPTRTRWSTPRSCAAPSSTATAGSRSSRPSCSACCPTGGPWSSG